MRRRVDPKIAMRLCAECVGGKTDEKGLAGTAVRFFVSDTDPAQSEKPCGPSDLQEELHRVEELFQLLVQGIVEEARLVAALRKPKVTKELTANNLGLSALAAALVSQLRVVNRMCERYCVGAEGKVAELTAENQRLIIELEKTQCRAVADLERAVAQEKQSRVLLERLEMARRKLQERVEVLESESLKDMRGLVRRASDEREQQAQLRWKIIADYEAQLQSCRAALAVTLQERDQARAERDSAREALHSLEDRIHEQHEQLTHVSSPATPRAV